MFCKIKTLALLFFAAHASLANNAVSKLNYKLDSAYGNFNSTDSYLVNGSATTPIGENFGLQIDSLYQKADTNEFIGIGGQFFWRDFTKGLLGVNCGIVHDDDVQAYATSFIGEYYYKDLTFGGSAGLSVVEYDKPVSFESSTQSDFLGAIYCTYYPIDDLSLSLSVQTKSAKKSLQWDLEYGLPINGVSVFASFQNAEDNYEHGYIGLRYYFGSNDKRTLKERHRQDDPINAVQGILHGIFHRSAERNRKGKEVYGEDWQRNLGSSVENIGGGFLVGPYDNPEH